MADAARPVPNPPAFAGEGRVGAAFLLTPALRQRLESIALGTAIIALLLVAWEWLPHLFPPQQGTRLFFTVPSRIFATLWQMFASGTIWVPLGVSATAFAIGLALAIAAGLPLGDAERDVRSLCHGVQRDATARVFAAPDAVARHRIVVESRRRLSRRAVSAPD